MYHILYEDDNAKKWVNEDYIRINDDLVQNDDDLIDYMLTYKDKHYLKDVNETIQEHYDKLIDHDKQDLLETYLKAKENVIIIITDISKKFKNNLHKPDTMPILYDYLDTIIHTTMTRDKGLNIKLIIQMFQPNRKMQCSEFILQKKRTIRHLKYFFHII